MICSRDVVVPRRLQGDCVQNRAASVVSSSGVPYICPMPGDSPWTHKPAPRCRPRPGEPLWSVRRNGVSWSAELRDHGEYGVEAQILRNGELSIGRRFPPKQQAVQWAENGRDHVGERLEDWGE
jgi:hypothetical protein